MDTELVLKKALRLIQITIQANACPIDLSNEKVVTVVVKLQK